MFSKEECPPFLLPGKLRPLCLCHVILTTRGRCLLVIEGCTRNTRLSFNTLLTRSYLLIKVFQMFVLYSVCSESSVV